MSSLKSKFNYEQTYTKFKDFKKKLNPFDAILFDSINISKCINLFQNENSNDFKKWIHVGIVVPNSFMNFNYKNNNETYIIESTYALYNHIINTDSNKLPRGLQIRKLEDVAKTHIKKGGTVVALKLLNNPFYLTVNEEKQLSYTEKQIYINSRLFKKYKINEFWNTYRNKKYVIFNCSKTVKKKFPFIKNNKQKKHFCSEAIIKLYQHLDIVDKNIKSEMVSPGKIVKYCLNNKNEIIFDPSNVIVLT